MVARLHPGAKHDIREIHGYYLESAGTDVAHRFRAELRVALARIENFPATWPVQFGARRCVLRSFPYSVFYEVDELGPIVVAISHHKRRPGHWKSRIRGAGQ